MKFHKSLLEIDKGKVDIQNEEENNLYTCTNIDLAFIQVNK